MLALEVDLETRSRINLKKCGVDRYAQHLSTEVLCLAWCTVDETPPRLWLPGDEVPDEFFRDELILFAHNAVFEELLFRYVMRKHGFPAYKQTQWRCTAVQAALMNLPRSLDGVGKALEIGSAKKDETGKRVMNRLCRPQKASKKALLEAGLPDKEKDVTEENGEFFGGLYDDTPAKHEKLREYCKQDVIAESAVRERTLFLTAQEKRLWFVDREINQRGIPIDRRFCEQALAIHGKIYSEGCTRLSELTEGRITSPDQTTGIPTEVARYGVVMPDLQSGTVNEFLRKKDLPEEVREILTIRSGLGFKAHKKYEAALANLSPDGRCREQIQFAQAGTGRWGGKGVQFHNLKKPLSGWPCQGAVNAILSGEVEELRSVLKEWNENKGGRFTVVDALSRSVRQMVMPGEGWELAVSDYASIEARVLSWVAGCKTQLQQFLNDEDVYLGLASRIYKTPLESMSKETHPDERQVGKAGILGLGYGMGAIKFAGTLGVAEEDVKTFHYDVVSTYRGTYPEIPELWRTLERAALYTVKTGKQCNGGMIVFRKEGDFLTLQLPSGRKLFYFKPEIQKGTYGPRVSYQGPRHRENMWGGVWVENVVQAIARDLLACALIICHNHGLRTILHVHDEIVNEVREGDQAAVQLTHDIMSFVPEWAKGCPIAAETSTTKRYNK